MTGTYLCTMTIIIIILVMFTIPLVTYAIKLLLEDDKPKAKRKQKYNTYKEINIFPYRKKELLTRLEHNFYNILKQQCDNAQLIICPKVRLEDFIEVTIYENKQKYRGYIKSRHVDFLICDNNLKVLAGIELDDSTHYNYQAQKTDKFKNELYKTIGIPLYRVKVDEGNYMEKVNNIIKELKTE